MNTLLAMSIGILLMAAPALGADLTEYRWKNRLLILFSPIESDPGYEVFQRELSGRRPEVEDRDLVLFRVLEKGLSHIDEQPLSMDDAQALRRHFEVKPGLFSVVLVGKDGGVKLAREQRADLQEIFDLIDSMPMRQQEMREKGKTR